MYRGPEDFGVTKKLYITPLYCVCGGLFMTTQGAEDKLKRQFLETVGKKEMY